MKNKSFQENYLANFKGILEASVDHGSPYQKAVGYLNEQFDRYNLSDELRARHISALMAELTVSFTNTAMQTATELAHRDMTLEEELRGLKLKNDLLEEKKKYEVEILKEQVELTKAQKAKTEADKALTEAQKKAIEEQVKDNRVIKASSVLGEFLQMISRNDLVAPAPMNQTLFSLILHLVKDEGITLPTIPDYQIKKGK
ncbi:hypothetical protein [Campylobacter sp. RM16188]|uniref:hypothetical protein n=1 Tax=Campylobacter sp. RM16188 TaxID=1705725 RepID=UPI001556271A|nr:hypothetical protein [Campylobacter sp. RM16188]